LGAEAAFTNVASSTERTVLRGVLKAGGKAVAVVAKVDVGVYAVLKSWKLKYEKQAQKTHHVISRLTDRCLRMRN
jgi:hypothetical protein